MVLCYCFDLVINNIRANFMLGVDPLTFSTLLVLAGTKLTCPSHEPTKINIIPRTEEVKYDYSKPLRDIQNYNLDTVDPYAFHGTTVTQALMRGQIELKMKTSFGQAEFQRFGYSCIWYKDITVELFIDPTIIIAKELYNDSCMRKALLEHELKHVRVDREIVNKYAKTMGTKIFEALKSRGFSVGPVPSDRLGEISTKMQKVVHQILDLEYKKLGIERAERQRAVDSLGEYESVDDKCPSFEKKKKALYSKL